MLSVVGDRGDVCMMGSFGEIFGGFIRCTGDFVILARSIWGRSMEERGKIRHWFRIRGNLKVS